MDRRLLQALENITDRDLRIVWGQAWNLAVEMTPKEGDDVTIKKSIVYWQKWFYDMLLNEPLNQAQKQGEKMAKHKEDFEQDL